jgi:two-component system response regulator PhoP
MLINVQVKLKHLKTRIDMRVLIAEDDSRLLTQLDALLQQNGYSVDLADNGEHGLYLIKEYTYDLAIIDIGMPKLDGFAVIRQARKDNITCPILILTARDRWQEKVEGLDAGADDYLTKPFHNEELLARAKALIRRASGQANPLIQFGPISLNTVSEELSVNDKPFDLTAYEYKVMEYLMMNPQKVVSKTELTEHIYDQDFDLDSNVIEVFIGRLRKKLDPDGNLKPIETLRGRGYRINRNL